MPPAQWGSDPIPLRRRCRTRRAAAPGNTQPLARTGVSPCDYRLRPRRGRIPAAPDAVTHRSYRTRPVSGSLNRFSAELSWRDCVLPTRAARPGLPLAPFQLSRCAGPAGWRVGGVGFAQTARAAPVVTSCRRGAHVGARLDRMQRLGSVDGRRSSRRRRRRSRRQYAYRRSIEIRIQGPRSLPGVRAFGLALGAYTQRLELARLRAFSGS